MPIIEVNSLNIQELDVYAKLTEKQLRSKVDVEKGIFIGEGNKVIEIALNTGCQPLSFLMEKKYLAGQCQEMLTKYPATPFYIGERELLAQLTGYKLTRGILGAFRRPAPQAVETILDKAKRIAVLDGITDATNVGAIVRSAAALNMDAVLFTQDCSDPLCRRSIRVSMGTILQIPWARLDNYAILRAHGFITVAMALKEDSINLDTPSLKTAEKLALIFGTEGYGLTQATIDACDYTVKIPMGHGVDSLNVAAASAVAFWELSK